MWAFLLAILYAPDVSLLGHEQFRIREAAHRRLQEAGELARPALQAQHLKGHCLEVGRRAGQLLGLLDSNPSVQLRRWLRHPRPPWLYLDGSWHAQATSHYLERAKRAGAIHEPPDWPSWREATRLWLRDQAAEGIPAEVILRALRPMMQAEADFTWGSWN